MSETILKKVDLGLLSSIDKEFLGISHKISEISEGIKQCVENILGEKFKELGDLLINLEAIGCIELSENPINNFPVETELKILDVNRELLIEKMDELGCKKTFAGIVDDMYFDFADLGLDKQDLSFRIRKKTYEDGMIKYFYTIKRKDDNKRKESGLRFSYERELYVPKPTTLLALVKDKGLRASRRKIKKRVSYFIPGINIKLDLDYYEGTKIPPLLEIEIDEAHKELLPIIYEALGIKENLKTSEGSRALYKRYGEEQTKYYQRNGINISWKEEKRLVSKSKCNLIKN